MNKLLIKIILIFCAFIILPPLARADNFFTDKDVCPLADKNPCNSECQADPVANKCKDPDPNAPAVKIIAPKSGAPVKGIVKVSIIKQDTTKIDKVELKVGANDESVGAISNPSFPISINLDTSKWADDDLTLSAFVTAGGHESDSDDINVVINNKDTTPPTTPPTTPANNTAVTNPCAPDSTSAQICNPLPDTDLKGLILRILQYLMGILGLVAVVIIVISGFRMVAGAGSEEQVKKAKTAITYAIVGLIISILAYSIVSIVQNVITKGK